MTNEEGKLKFRYLQYHSSEPKKGAKNAGRRLQGVKKTIFHLQRLSATKCRSSFTGCNYQTNKQTY